MLLACYLVKSTSDPGEGNSGHQCKRPPELSAAPCGAPALGIMDRGSVDDDVSPQFEERMPPPSHFLSHLPLLLHFCKFPSFSTCPRLFKFSIKGLSSVTFLAILDGFFIILSLLFGWPAS